MLAVTSLLPLVDGRGGDKSPCHVLSHNLIVPEQGVALQATKVGILNGYLFCGRWLCRGHHEV